MDSAADSWSCQRWMSNILFAGIQTVTKHDNLIRVSPLSCSDYYDIWRTWFLPYVEFDCGQRSLCSLWFLVMCGTARWRPVVMGVSSEPCKRSGMLHDLLEHLHENPRALAHIKGHMETLLQVSSLQVSGSDVWLQNEEKNTSVTYSGQDSRVHNVKTQKKIDLYTTS